VTANPRSAVSREIAGFADRGIRSILVAVPPVVHSTRDRGGIPVRAIAETIGRHLGVPAVSIPAEEAVEHFGPFGAIMTLGLPPLSNAATRELLDWKPEYPGLLADLDEGHYLSTR
jgi:hypothetical protein